MTMPNDNAQPAASRAGLLRAGAAGCLIVAGAGLATRALLPVGSLYPWKAAAVFAAVMAIALSFAREHPFTRLGPANQITIVRAMLTALAAALIGEPQTSQLAIMAIVAASASAVLDGVDGSLARRTGMASAFGGRFDVETDAALILVLSLLVWQHDKAGAWVLASGLMRYGFVASQWLLPWMAGPLSPTRRGRVVAVTQMVGLSLALLPAVSPPQSTLVAAVTVLTLTWSFALDVRRLWKQHRA